MRDAFALVGDCRDLPLPDESIDAVVTDPPYGLNFMNRAWDHDVPGPDYWREVFRVMKPGAHLLAFGGTRTWHWLTVGIEEAGFEVRDCLSWMYGTGFPKSHNIARAVDKKRGTEGEWEPEEHWNRAGPRDVPSRVFNQADHRNEENPEGHRHVYEPGEAGEHWQGWGTALKPAWEPIVLAMKPTDGTFAENALEYGVAGLNIDGCRVGVEPSPSVERRKDSGAERNSSIYGKRDDHSASEEPRPGEQNGRWPANVTLSHLTRPTVILDKGLAADTERVIREYFDGYNRVRRVRRRLRRDSEPGGEAKVLQRRVPQRVADGSEADRVRQADLRDVWGSVRDPSCMGEERTPEVLQPRVQGRIAGRGDGRGSPEVGGGTLRRIEAEDVGIDKGKIARLEALGSPELERGPVPRRAWLRPRPDNRAGGSGAGAGRSDVDGPVRPGASAGHGEGAGPTAGNGRGGTPRQRRQTGQPDREPGNLRPGGTQQRASGDRAEGDETEGGEPTLEVFAEDIPAGWRKYFRPYDDLGCRRVGTKEVRSGVSGPKSKDSFEAPSVLTDGEDLGADEKGTERGYGPVEETEDWDCPPSCPVRMLDEQSGETSYNPEGVFAPTAYKRRNEVFGEDEEPHAPFGYGDTGGASRFYYCAKASRSEREAGLPSENGDRANHHPTVKPIDLCRWLVRLVTRKGHVVLDPFMGSGSIGCAALQERRRYIGLDLNPEYVEIARARLEHWAPKQVDLFKDGGT